MRAAGQAERLERELVELSGRVDGHNQSLAREFDRVLDVLDRRGLRRRRRLDADARRRGAGPRLPRGRPPRRRVPAGTGCSTASTPPSSAGLLSVFVYEHRSPEPAAAAVVPVDRRPRPLASARRHERGPRRRRALDRPRRAPPARSRLRRRRPRLGARRGPRRRRRRRAADRRRLRADDEAADRPGPPGGARRARSRRPGAGPARWPSGRSAAWSPTVWSPGRGGDRRRPGAGRSDDDPPRRDVGRGWSRRRPTCWSTRLRRRAGRRTSSPAARRPVPCLAAATSCRRSAGRPPAPGCCGSRSTCCGSRPTTGRYVAVAHVVAHDALAGGAGGARSSP